MLHLGISVSEMGYVAEEDLMKDEEEFVKAKGNLAEEEIIKKEMKNYRSQKNVEEIDVLLDENPIMWNAYTKKIEYIINHRRCELKTLYIYWNVRNVGYSK